jgi:Domain of unknown function (DUF4755)
MLDLLFLSVLGLIGYLIYLSLKKKTNNMTSTRDFIDLGRGFEFHHSHKGTGIALDRKTEKIVLMEAGRQKEYAFSAVRNWETNISTGGGVIGGGLVGVAANRGAQAQNQANTGLFIEMKDIDNPKWHITFGPSDLKKELPRWMEILRQSINKDS